jgi:hypothetical protein
LLSKSCTLARKSGFDRRPPNSILWLLASPRSRQATHCIRAGRPERAPLSRMGAEECTGDRRLRGHERAAHKRASWGHGRSAPNTASILGPPLKGAPSPGRSRSNRLRPERARSCDTGYSTSRHTLATTLTVAARPKGGGYSLYHDGARGFIDDPQIRIPLILGVGGRVTLDELHGARFVVLKCLPWLGLPNKAGKANDRREDDPPPPRIPPPLAVLDLCLQPGEPFFHRIRSRWRARHSHDNICTPIGLQG